MLSLIYSSTLNQRHKIYKEETKTNKRQCPEPSKSGPVPRSVKAVQTPDGTRKTTEELY